MKASRHRICVVPIDDIPAIIPKVIAAHISAYLNLQAEVLAPMADAAFALDVQRHQYNAAVILQHLESTFPSQNQKVIGVLDVDLFLPVFSHVYGEARQGGRAALLSLCRLRENGNESLNDSPIVLERVAKIALHELCHLFDVTHCESHACLMHFSGNLMDLDRMPLGFCRYCSQYIREATKMDPSG